MMTFEHCTPGAARAARRLIRHILADGNVVSISDGEDEVVTRANRERLIYPEMCASDEDHVTVHDAHGKRLGWFWLVYGNDPAGEELIADHSDNDYCNSVFEAVTSS